MNEALFSRDVEFTRLLFHLAIAGLGFVISIIIAVLGWFIRSLVSRITALEASTGRKGIEIRDNRAAISRVEGHLRLQPYHYNS